MYLGCTQNYPFNNVITEMPASAPAVSAVPNASYAPYSQTQAQPSWSLFISGANMLLGWSDPNWTALSLFTPGIRVHLLKKCIKQSDVSNTLLEVTSNEILGVLQCTLTDLFNRQIIRKANAILSDSSHPLHSEFQFLPSGPRLRLSRMESNRYKHSFVPTAISLLYSGQGRRSRTWLVDILWFLTAGCFLFLSPCGVIDVGRNW